MKNVWYIIAIQGDLTDILDIVETKEQAYYRMNFYQLYFSDDWHLEVVGIDLEEKA